ncbi:SMC-Scp complex subunit ScpB [Micromonospora sp. NPDC050397]|uniref:SMC-Scp complex subunit ScpB n=1 Tax=Micromonospora sp. NPDC050397 TaxID=3364279 RepID=UPI00384AB88A
MTSDERRDGPESLADQAAAWVPPWARQNVTPPQRQAEVPAEPAEPVGRRESVESAEPGESVGQAAVVSVGAGEADPSEEQPAPSAATDPPPPAASSPAEPPVDGPVGRPNVPPTGPSANGPVGRPNVPPTELPADGSAERRAVPAEGPATLALVDDDELRAALEAILLVVDEPVAEIVLAQVLEQPTDRVAGMLERLADDYTSAGHGFDLRRAAGGWRLYTRPEYATYVERFVLNGQAVRLTQAALETLAVVAYKQPVTRSRISAIRGVNCDGVIRTLVSRGLVEECGSEPDSGAFLYRTTTLFLEKLGLNTVDELPPLAPFLPDDLEEIADAPR